jgi:hypothetical protein
MLEKLTDLPHGLVGVKGVGRVTKEDYERVVEPILAEARREERRVRLLCELGPEFGRISAGAVWEEAKLSLRSLRHLDGGALVTDVDWIRASTRVAAFVMPCAFRAFASGERAQAIDWLAGLPQASGMRHRLLGDQGVILVELTGPLRANDFDALAVTADAWIEAYGCLQGIVVHARAFPGWENWAALCRHVQFVREHHRYVHRVALAADGMVASLLPRIGRHLVRAEVKRFDCAGVDAAIVWATGPGPGP